MQKQAGLKFGPKPGSAVSGLSHVEHRTGKAHLMEVLLVVTYFVFNHLTPSNSHLLVTATFKQGLAGFFSMELDNKNILVLQPT